MSFFILVVDVEYSFYLNNCLFWTWVFPYILFFSCFLLFLLFPFFVCFSYSFAIFIVVQSWKGWYPRYPKIKFSTSDFMIFEVLQRVQFPQLCSTILLTSIAVNRNCLFKVHDGNKDLLLNTISCLLYGRCYWNCLVGSAAHAHPMRTLCA